MGLVRKHLVEKYGPCVNSAQNSFAESHVRPAMTSPKVWVLFELPKGKKDSP